MHVSGISKGRVQIMGWPQNLRLRDNVVGKSENWHFSRFYRIREKETFVQAIFTEFYTHDGRLSLQQQSKFY